MSPILLLQRRRRRRISEQALTPLLSLRVFEYWGQTLRNITRYFFGVSFLLSHDLITSPSILFLSPISSVVFKITEGLRADLCGTVHLSRTSRRILKEATQNYFKKVLKHLNKPQNAGDSSQGSSLGQFFKQYLEPIKLNDVQVDWKSMDLSYMMEDNYVKHFAEMVQKAKPVYGADAVLQAYNIDGDGRVHYKDQADFECIAHQFGIFEEWKDGVPRTAYKGVVFQYETRRRVFLVGPESFQLLGIEHAQ